MRNKKATLMSGFCCTATMGACSQIVALITKNAVQSTAFLLRIAEGSKGKALSGADFVCGVANPALLVIAEPTQ